MYLPNLIFQIDKEKKKLNNNNKFKASDLLKGIDAEKIEAEKNLCLLDNNQRLDKIVNLKDIIKFKVNTVAE